VPPPWGAHELAWSYLLDLVFADAYHSSVSALTIVVPDERLVAAVELRTRATPPGRADGAPAVAELGGAPFAAVPEPRYRLCFGVLAPPQLWRPRCTMSAPAGRVVSVLTARARAMGVAVRAAAALARPDLEDKAHFAMRSVFAAHSWEPAFYHLRLPAAPADPNAPGYQPE
jgi:hypothetical protein